MIASAAGCSSPSERWLCFGVGARPPGLLDGVQDRRGQALDLHRALDVVLDGVGRPFGRQADARTDRQRHDDRRDHQPRDRLRPASLPEKPCRGDRDGHQREELQRSADAEEREPRLRPSRYRPRPARPPDTTRAPGRSACGSSRRSPRGASATTRSATHSRPPPSAASRPVANMSASGEDERQHRERVAEGLGVERDEPGQRDQRRRERRVLEADLAVGHDPVQKQVGVRSGRAGRR